VELMEEIVELQKEHIPVGLLVHVIKKSNVTT